MPAALPASGAGPVSTMTSRKSPSGAASSTSDAPRRSDQPSGTVKFAESRRESTFVMAGQRGDLRDQGTDYLLQLRDGEEPTLAPNRSRRAEPPSRNVRFAPSRT